MKFSNLFRRTTLMVLFICIWSLSFSALFAKSVTTDMVRNKIGARNDTCAVVKTDGTLWIWGKNSFGIVGNGTKNPRSTPYKALDNVKKIAMGSYHILALKNDGTVWAWGNNSYSQLGDGTNVSQLKPKQVYSGDVKEIDAGYYSSTIILNNGNIATLGVPDTTDTYSVYSSPAKTFEEELSKGSKTDIRGTVGWQCSLSGNTVKDTLHNTTILSDIKAIYPLTSPSVTNYGLTTSGNLYGWNAPNFSSALTNPTLILSSISYYSYPTYSINGGFAVTRSNELYRYHWIKRIENEKYSEAKFSTAKIADDIVAAEAGDSIGIAIGTDGTVYEFGDGENLSYEPKMITTLGDLSLIQPDNPDEGTDTPDPDSPELSNPESYEDLENEFKRNYVQSHINYINGKYKSEITQGFSGALGEAVQTVREDKFNNIYDFNQFMSQMLSASYKQDEAPYLAILTSYIDTDVSANYYSDVFYSQSLDKYFDNAGSILKALERAGKIKDGTKKLENISKMAVNSSQFKSAINEIDSIIDSNLSAQDVQKYLNIKEAQTVLKNVTGAIGKSASETLHFIDNYQAYQAASDKLIQSLEDMKSVVGRSSTYPGKNQLEGTQFASGMSKAITRMINEIKEAKSGSSSTAIAKKYASSLVSNGTQAAASEFGSVLIGSIPCVSTIRSALGGINHISDFFYNGKSRNYNADLIKKLDLSACVIRAAADKKASELKSTSKLDSKFNKAVEFDYLIQLYKSTLIQGYNNTRDFIKNSIIPNKKTGKVTDSTLEAIKEGKLTGGYQSLVVGIEEQINEINQIRCHDPSFDSDISRKVNYYSSSESSKLRNYLIACPVNVIVKDNSGKVFATLTDSGVNCPEGYERFFFVYQEEDGSFGKSVIIPSDYSVELEGTGSGNLSALVNHYDNNTNTKTYLFNNLSINSSTKGSFERDTSGSDIYNLKINGTDYKPDIIDSEIPSQPSNPDTPDQPAEPDNPDQPSDPDTPVTPNQNDPHIQYQSHIENLGWVEYVKDGAPAGTEGQGLRQEAIRIQVVDSKGNPYSGLGVTYRSHVQDEGWQNYVSDNAVSGTTGKARKVEAVQIKLTGSKADQYDVWYQTHIEDYGWTNWAKNGEACGSEGFNKRMESIRIQILPKNSSAPSGSGLKLYSSYGPGLVRYRAHVENLGWQSYVSDGQNAGTTGQNLKLESLIIAPSPELPQGDIQASAHVQDIGWTNYVPSYNVIGTIGQNKRLEAIKLRLTGDLAKEYDIVYQSHVQNEGWQNEVRNDAVSGTTGLSRKIEAINIKLVKKGSSTTPSEPVTVPVTGIILNQKSLTLDPGEKFNLTYKITPDNATNKNLTWKSDNESIATVSSSGLVTAKGAGSTTVTATTQDGGYKASCSITVKAKIVNVESVTLNYSSYQLKPGETLSLIATIYPENATNKIISWSSSNPDIVSVDAIGNIRAIKNGTATVTVTTEDNSRTASCYVVVTDSTTSGDYYKFVFDKSEITIKVGETVTIPFTIDPEAEYSIVGYSFKKEIVSVAPSQKDVTITGEHVGDAEVSLEAHINGQDKQPRGTIKVHVIN